MHVSEMNDSSNLLDPPRTIPDMKQLRIFARILLFLIFGAHLRSGRLTLCLRRLPEFASSAR